MNSNENRMEPGAGNSDWIDALLSEDAAHVTRENDPTFVARVMQALPEQNRLDVVALLSMGLSAAACALAAVFLTDHRLELVQNATSSLGGMKLESLVASLICCLVFSGLAGLSYYMASDPDSI